MLKQGKFTGFGTNWVFFPWLKNNIGEKMQRTFWCQPLQLNNYTDMEKNEITTSISFNFDLAFLMKKGAWVLGKSFGASIVKHCKSSNLCNK